MFNTIKYIFLPHRLYTRLKAKSGYLMIFNQQNFTIPGVSHRAGSNKDEEALCRTFYDFGFNPVIKRDLRLKDVDKVAKECGYFFYNTKMSL